MRSRPSGSWAPPQLVYLALISLILFFSFKNRSSLLVFNVDRDLPAIGQQQENSNMRRIPQPLVKCSRDASVPQRIPVFNKKLSPRFTKEMLSKYIQKSHKEWEGWMHLADMYIMGYLSRVQHKRMGLQGTVGEIGVHHGKFTVPIAMFALPNEPVWAADLFETMQDQNVDGSGLGNRGKFTEHLREYGITTNEGPDNQIKILSINSLELKPSHLDGFDAFRMLSIDGGHMHDLTINDLLFSCEVVREGGIVILDDFVNPGWLGAVSGLFSFIQSQSYLQPFYWGQNKLFLTTPGYGEKYIESLEEIGLCKGRNFVNERKVFPSKMCWIADVRPNVPKPEWDLKDFLALLD